MFRQLIENKIFNFFLFQFVIDYDVGASTSEVRSETGNVEQQEEDAGDGVSSEGEKPPAQDSNEVQALKIDIFISDEVFFSSIWV